MVYVDICTHTSAPRGIPALAQGYDIDGSSLVLLTQTGFQAKLGTEADLRCGIDDMCWEGYWMGVVCLSFFF